MRKDEEQYQRKSQFILQKVVDNLGGIESLEELLLQGPLLEEFFCELVDVIIEARGDQEGNYPQRKENKELSEILQKEMQRIYRIEGARALFEKIQRKALERLDTFEKKLIKKRQHQLAHS